ncbi:MULTISPECIES: putative bifunctional diguanylate cyclase/phosphodiesterase [unclassified Arsukibacterium]|uniref:putative bifunctional diguanylate cyclase/phosphodiesterase n=1 Tax=unclassified Arsukibacterium TaxID=2635278 RepID=UPI0025BFE51B|nr:MULTISPECIES: bifunctional diguanylate cyclase/phosphodiesterase [unclassified Arsukibacterium]|tara:strand:+ start:49570 stop:51435 length:1866 start_codon:yes stop_codon:yes gene_type:complete
MPLSGWLCFFALLPAFSVRANIADGLSATPIPLLLLSFISGIIIAGAAGLWRVQHLRSRQNAQQKVIRQLLNDTRAFVAVLDQDCQLLAASSALENISERQNLCNSMYFDPVAKKKAWQDIQQVLQQHRSWQGEVWWQLRNDLLAVSLTIAQSNNTAWPAARYLLVAQDITERKRADQQQLNNLTRDPLTGLPNRIMLEEQLATNIACCTNQHPTTAILLIKFNQLLGSEPTGSGQSNASLIAEAAKGLRQAIAPQFTLGRYSSDSFAILAAPHLCALPVELPLNQLAYQILIQINQFNFTRNQHQVYASIGISRFPEDGADASALMHSAERAVHIAAKSGTSQFYFADNRLQQHAAEYLTLQTELSKSLNQDDFTVYFQPQLSISSNRVVGYEALLRWHNPKRGIMQPQSFLALAEQSGMIVALDRLVFRQCCQQVKHWLQTNQLRGRIALNISVQHFEQVNFVEFLSEALLESKLQASHFTLELDERIFQQQVANLQQRLKVLSDTGFHIVLDNFGDGISSLTSLRQLPLQGVKIARSLIHQMEQKEQQRNITASLIRLAGYLQLEVTASGIDNEMQAYLLHVMGCDKLQGNLFSKAVPASEIPALLAKESKLIKKAAS